MYSINRPIPSQFGNFKEGATDALKTVPQGVIDSWVEAGIVSKKTLPPMPLSEEPPIPQNEEVPTPEDTKRTTYERKRR